MNVIGEILKVRENSFALTGIAIGTVMLLLSPFMLFDGLLGVSRLGGLKFHWVASHWKLKQVEATPERLDGVVVGMRVKARLLLSKDIDIKNSYHASKLPFNVTPLIVSGAGGQTLFPSKGRPTIRRDGVTLGIDRFWS